MNITVLAKEDLYQYLRHGMVNGGAQELGGGGQALHATVIVTVLAT